jgi:hypothetical protein
MGGFDDLDKAVAEEDAEYSDSGADDVPDPAPDTTSTTEQSSTTADVATTSGEQEAETEEEDVLNTPAFAFGDTKQQQMYVRPEVWSNWEDLRKFEVERELADRDIRGVEGRELDEAAIRVLLEHPDEVADYVEAARRDDV